MLTVAGTMRDTRPAATLIGVLSEAAHQRRRVRLRYRAARGEETAREVDVYGVVCREGTWYAVGFDHLRAGLRTFRVDRVRDARMREETFTPPADFDVLAHLERALATAPGILAIEVLLETTLEEARRLVPGAYGVLEETPRGVLARGQAQDRRDLGALAHILAGLGCPLVVLHPPELRDELRALAMRAAWLADRVQE